MESVVSRRGPPSGAESPTLSRPIPSRAGCRPVATSSLSAVSACAAPWPAVRRGRRPDRPSGAAVEHEGEGAVVVLADAARPGMQAEVDAVGAQAGRDQLGGLLREGAQEAAAGHERHGRAKAGVSLGEFDAGNPAAEYREPLRDRAGGGRLPGGPVLDVVKPLDRRLVGGGSRGDHHGVPGRERVAVAVQPGHLHLPRSGDPAVAADQFDPGVLHPLDLAVVLPVRGEVVPALQDGGRIQGAGDGFLGAGDGLRAVQCGARTQERLRRHAGPVGALAAHQLRLDEHRRQAAADHAVRHVLAHGARADHNDIEFPLKLCRHGTSLRRGLGPFRAGAPGAAGVAFRRNVPGRAFAGAGTIATVGTILWGRRRPWPQAICTTARSHAAGEVQRAGPAPGASGGHPGADPGARSCSRGPVADRE